VNLTDARGLAVSAPSRDALAGFEKALIAWYSFKGEPLSLIDSVLAQWPDFGMAHILRALVLIGLGEQRFSRAARRSLDHARGRHAELTSREQQLFTIAEDLLQDRSAAASQKLDALLVAEPKDLLSLHLGHSIDFNRGDHWNLRNRVMRVLPYWQQSDPGYANVLAMLAFGLEECNQYPQAEETGQQALALAPDNPWAIHAIAHVMEMCGRIDDGVEHLRRSEKHWAVDSPFAYHNWWHLALFHLDRNEPDVVLALYDEHIDTADAGFALGKLDATSLLWRLQLLNLDVAQRWLPLSAWWREQLERECGHNAFHDFHAALAFAAIGDLESLHLMQRLLRERNGSSAAGHSSVQLTLTLPLVSALLAYTQEAWTDAAAALVPLRDAAYVFGGSHAQRDVITLTLIAAAANGHEQALAEHFLNERLVAKPASPLGWRLKERLLPG